MAAASVSNAAEVILIACWFSPGYFTICPDLHKTSPTVQTRERCKVAFCQRFGLAKPVAVSPASMFRAKAIAPESSEFVCKQAVQRQMGFNEGGFDNDIAEILVDPDILVDQPLHDILVIDNSGGHEFQQIVIAT